MTEVTLVEKVKNSALCEHVRIGDVTELEKDTLIVLTFYEDAWSSQ